MALEDTLEWRIELGASEPKKKGIILLAAFVVAAIGVLLPYSGLVYGLVGFALIISSNAELFLPQIYKVTQSGVERKCGLSLSSMEWDQIKRIVVDETGAKCSPFSKPTRSEPFRGVYLRFANNRELVLAKIHEHFHGDPEFLGRGTDGGGNPEPMPTDRPRDHETSA